ncbi:hypothetical protein EVAR_3812_1 [Eumeta japonica]|uniref:Uncharacterized protein n=1 Tax=Eumeta variegata TaxID=151549 RepID=A0A4C1SS26_EUMVA|nr:hypothetical protein EVAR_3812_1 [Eumeta japonica]
MLKNLKEKERTILESKLRPESVLRVQPGFGIRAEPDAGIWTVFGALLNIATCGFNLGYPTILFRDLRAEGSPIPLTLEEESWISFTSTIKHKIQYPNVPSIVKHQKSLVVEETATLQPMDEDEERMQVEDFYEENSSETKNICLMLLVKKRP